MILIWMNWWIDLTNLISITSVSHSFYHPRSVTLSSIIMIESWIDIPNLQTVDLPDSFSMIEKKSIDDGIEWIHCDK